MAKSKEDTNVILVLSWLFAPIVGLFFLSHEDADVKWHAKQSVYFGLADIILQFVFLVVSIILTVSIILACLTVCVGIVWFAWFAVSVVVRIYGAVQASQGVRWEVPVLSSIIKQ